MTVSIVTGAGSGIGEATARRLSVRGDKVLCVDINAEAAAAVAEGIQGARAFAADISREKDCEAMVEAACESFGMVNALVNSAGIEKFAPPLEITLDDFQRVVDVNLTGSFLTARCAAQAMKQQGTGGSIVLIGSINSQIAIEGSTAYAASKGGVLMLGRGLALDLAADGIRINVIGPGVVHTPMSANSLADPQRRAMLLGKTPLGRPADPMEIAEVAEFLTSERSSFMTGAYVPVDGGWLSA